MKKTTNSSPYQFEGRIPLSQAIPLGLQHVMAMFIGNLTPLIIVMGACGLTADAGFAELRTDVFHRTGRRKGTYRYGNLFGLSWSIK